MTCKDCIHYFVCDMSGGEIYVNEQAIRDDCHHFMRKDNTVEVIRCGECIHRNSGRMACQGRHPDFYCGIGERRDQNEG